MNQQMYFMQRPKEVEANIFAVSCKNLGKKAALDGLI